MKILIPTPILPHLRSLRIDYVNLVMEELSKQTSVDICWFTYTPTKIQIKNSANKFYFDIHSFTNGLDFLNEIKPNLILVNESKEPIQYSLSLAAKFLQIPIASFILHDYDEQFNISNSKNFYKQSFLTKVKKFFLLSIQSQGISDPEKKFFSRLRFYFYKKNFLKNTIQSININQKLQSDINVETPFNTLSDVYLLPNDSWITHLQNIGIPKNKIVITGNPLFDVYFKILKQSKIPYSTKISILIVTDSLYEHGFWSKHDRDLFLKSLLNTLNLIPNISIAIKIHPSSESLSYYRSLMKYLDMNIAIYQNEILFDLIQKFELILTYGFSTSHTQIACAEKKMIFYNLSFNIPKMKLIDSGIKSGFIKEITSFDKLNDAINELHNSDIITTEEFVEERKKFLFRSDGNSAKRICAELIRLLNH